MSIDLGFVPCGLNMGRRKFKLSTHRKNEERKKQKGRAQLLNQTIQEPEHGLFHCYTDILFGISPLEQSLEEPRTKS